MSDSAAETLRNLLKARSSIRAFSSRPVPEDVLARILDAALESPSWSNTQPYKIAVAQGRLRDALAEDFCARYDEGQAVLALSKWQKLLQIARLRRARPKSDYWLSADYPAELQPARRATGFGLYKVLGIERHDMAARSRQMRRNFEFFGAPAALFLFAHEGLGSYSVLDAGIFLQSLMLAAKAEGLGTCAQGALATWSAPVHQHFDVPASYKLVCGLALGYPAEDKVNAFRPEHKGRGDLLIAPK